MVKIVKGLQKARIELKPLLDGFGEAVYCEWPGHCWSLDDQLLTVYLSF